MGQAIDFQIPAQPLAAALVAFSRVSGVQVLYDSQAAAEKVSTAVSGRMASGLALRDMLQGTGLQIRYAGRRSVTLVLPDAKDAGATMRLETLRVEAAPAHIGGQRFAAYADSVLADLRRALQADDGAARAGYAVTVRLWLDPAGRVTKSQILKSTGDSRFDAGLSERLLAVAADPPPPDLPQPLAFELWTRGRP